MYDIISEQTLVNVRRSNCHKVLIENDTDGPHIDGSHDGPIQYNIAS
jgi:hypothetical protein